ncbi:MAG: hypothetical protein ABFS05_07805, partial [Bacteroidota bacterium]
MTEHTPQPPRQQDDIDIKKLLLKFLAYWHWFVAGLILAVLIGWIVNRYTTPVYQVKSSLLIKEYADSSPLSASGPMSGEGLEGFALMDGYTNLYNQQEIIRSWPIIQKTLEELDFEVSYFVEGRVQLRETYRGAPFEVVWKNDHPQLTGLDFHLSIAPDGSIDLSADGENVKVHNYQTRENTGNLPEVSIDESYRAGEYIETDNFAFSIRFKPGFRPKETSGYMFRFNTMEQLKGRYASKLSLEIMEEYSSILSLKLNDAHAGKGINFLNMLMAVYEQDNLDQKNDYARRTIAFISNQLASISDSLNVSEEEMLNFRSDNKVVDLTTQSEILLHRLTELDNQKVLLEAQNKYYHYLHDYITESQELETIMAPSAMGVDDPLLSSLIEDLNGLILEKARLGKVKDSPRLNQLNAQIEQLKDLYKALLKIAMIQKENAT